jgi:Spy/CpxP family protein refolding chaperone
MKMNIRLSLKLLIATAISLSATAASAQQGRGQGNRLGGESPNDPSYLLASESVQKELALSDDQNERLEKIWDDEQNGARNFFRGFIGLSQAEIQKRIDQRARATRKKIAKILTPEQMTRLDEINFQVGGVAALTYDDVADKLKLTPEQKKELTQIGHDSRQKLAALYAPGSGLPSDAEGQAERKQKHDEITAERATKSLAVLTDEQKSAFEKLQGEKFDVTTIRPRSRNFTNRGRIEPPPIPRRVPG